MSALEIAPQGPTLANRLRLPFVGLAGGLLAGLINAVNARLLMRLVALATTRQGGFSAGGTAAIFGFAALLGPLLGLLFIVVRRWLPGRWLIQALLFAAILCLGFQLPIFQIAPQFRDEVMAAGALGLSVFLLINLIFCLLVSSITAWIDRRWVNLAQYAGPIVAATAGLTLLALAGAGVLIYQLGGRLIGIVE